MYQRNWCWSRGVASIRSPPSSPHNPHRCEESGLLHATPLDQLTSTFAISVAMAAVKKANLVCLWELGWSKKSNLEMLFSPVTQISNVMSANILKFYKSIKVWHSLIITREGLIWTLSIHLTLQGWIWCPSLPVGEYWPILSLEMRFSNTLPAEDWAPILARWTWSN